MKAKLALAGVAVALAAIPVAAHHSFLAEYDPAAIVTLKGVVTKVEWANPHVYIYIDVKDETGKVVNWFTEGYPPNTLTRTGFTKDIVKEGDMITLTAYRARDSASRAAGHELTTADGAKHLFGPFAPVDASQDWQHWPAAKK